MKKILIAAVCVLSAATLSAQRASSTSTSFFSTERPEKTVNLGLRAGYTLSNVVAKSDGESASPSGKSGFLAGLNVDVAFMQSFGLNTGIFAVSKGYKSSDKEYGYEMTKTFNPMYLEIPVLASYRFNFGETSRVEVDFGPYFAVGVGGKDKVKYKYDGDSDSESEKIFGGEYGANRFDCGLKVGAGVTFNKIYVGLHYAFGLTNLYDYDDYSIRNRNLSLTMGFNF